MKRNDLLKLAFLIFLAIGQLACSSTNTTPNQDELSDNPNQSGNGGGDPGVIVEPNPTPPGGSTVNPTPEGPVGEVCDEPITIVSNELTPTKAGELYQVDLLQGGCGQVVCESIEVPEGLALEGCQLQGTLNAMGEYEVKVKVGEEEKTFTLVVEDNLKIILAKGGNVLLFEAGGEFNLPDNGDNMFHITLGKDAIYAKIDGLSDYDVTLSHPDFSLISLGGNLYRLKPPQIILFDDQNKAVFEGLILSVDNTGVSRDFDVTIYANPFDQPLKIKPFKVIREGATMNEVGEIQPNDDFKVKQGPWDFEKHKVIETGDYNIDVDLGTKYHIVFKADGAGPFQWSFGSKVGPKLPELKCDLPDHLPDFLGDEINPKCDDFLTTNENWQQVWLGDEDWVGPKNISKEDSDNHVYLQLTTDFSFPGKVLPYSTTFDYLVYDQLEVTAETSAYPTATSLKEKATYSLNHILKLPDEGAEEIQAIQVIGHIGDTEDHAEMRIHFKNGKQKEKQRVATIEYRLDECAEDYGLCEAAAKPDPDSMEPNSGSVATIDGIEIEFKDWDSDEEQGCFNCSDTQLDFDLVSLTVFTPYRIFRYVDPIWGKGLFQYSRIHGDVTPAQDQPGWDRAGLVLAEPQAPQSRTYDLTPILLPGQSIWLPRSKPYYGSN